MTIKQPQAEDTLVGIIPEKERYMNLVWQVSDICNFRCSYCNEGNWGGKSPNLETKKYIAFLDRVIKYYEKKGYKGFKFFFSGGEPTRWPPMLEIANYLHDRLEAPLLAINTNLSSKPSWWEENYYLFQDVVGSFHVEFVNKERYLENALFLQDKVNYLALRLMMQKDRFQEIVDFSKILKSKLDNYNIEYAPILAELTSWAEPYQYDETWQMEFFKTHSFESQQKIPKTFKPFNIGHSKEIYSDINGMEYELPLNSNRLLAGNRNFFKGWKCWINESLFININGDISAATCGAHKNLGNINNDEIEFLEDAIICPKDYCSCGTDILITKTRPGYSDKVDG